MAPTTIDPMKDLPGYALRRASSAVMAKLARRLQPLKLRPAEATVLVVIGANPGITQSEIGRMLDIASANMAPLAARLESKDLIVREPVNRRSQGLRLSDSGRRLMQRAWQIMQGVEAELCKRIPASRRAVLLGVLLSLAAEPGEQESS